MEAITFEEWWREFWQMRTDKDGGYDAADDLQKYMSRLDTNRFEGFAAELRNIIVTRSDRWGVAQRALDLEIQRRTIGA